MLGVVILGAACCHYSGMMHLLLYPCLESEWQSRESRIHGTTYDTSVDIMEVRKQANTNKEANKQANKQANTNKEANKQANKQTRIKKQTLVPAIVTNTDVVTESTRQAVVRLIA
eukprot:9479970-Pyramimonas_sp.AAC.1